jgi:hypothetical protein
MPNAISNLSLNLILIKCLELVLISYKIVKGNLAFPFVLCVLLAQVVKILELESGWFGSIVNLMSLLHTESLKMKV